LIESVWWFLKHLVPLMVKWRKRRSCVMRL
jgi:hypothetical protein